MPRQQYFTKKLENDNFAVEVENFGSWGSESPLILITLKDKLCSYELSPDAVGTLFYSFSDHSVDLFNSLNELLKKQYGFEKIERKDIVTTAKKKNSIYIQTTCNNGGYVSDGIEEKDVDYFLSCILEKLEESNIKDMIGPSRNYQQMVELISKEYDVYDNGRGTIDVYFFRNGFYIADTSNKQVLDGALCVKLIYDGNLIALNLVLKTWSKEHCIGILDVTNCVAEDVIDILEQVQSIVKDNWKKNGEGKWPPRDTIHLIRNKNAKLIKGWGDF